MDRVCGAGTLGAGAGGASVVGPKSMTGGMGGGWLLGAGDGRAVGRAIVAGE